MCILSLSHEAHVACAADALLDLALLHRGDARDAGGNDLAVFGDVVLENLDIVQVDLVVGGNRRTATRELFAVGTLSFLVSHFLVPCKVFSDQN